MPGDRSKPPSVSNDRPAVQPCTRFVADSMRMLAEERGAPSATARRVPTRLPAIFGPDVARALGEALRAARLFQGMTLAQVARKTGNHRPIIGRTERGIHTPRTDLLLVHAWAVGMSTVEVLAIVDDVARASLVPSADTTRRST